jgi:hypothetical protein
MRLLTVIGGVVLAALLAVVALSPTANATHSWSNYHWARTTSTFAVQLDNNTSSAWGTYLGTASTDWSKSSVLDTYIRPSVNTKQCSATSGRVEVCNANYGRNGWLGLASVWTSGGHIVQGTAKMNDTYFDMARYNKPGWRHLVMCQEVGHTFGLAHQNENYNNMNFGTCMDYSSDPDGTLADPDQLSNEHPNQHDYDQLAAIYKHLDTTTTVNSASAANSLPPAARAVNTANPSERGQLVHESADGGVAVYVREFGEGQKVITRVIRSVEGTPALDANGAHEHHHDH